MHVAVFVGIRGGSYRGGGGGRLWNDYEFNYNSVGLPRNTRNKVTVQSCVVLFFSIPLLLPVSSVINVAIVILNCTKCHH